MSASPSFPEPAVVVAALRAAGCVYAEDEAQLLIDQARTPADLTAMVDRRAAGHPLEHILGWAEFCGLRIAVDPGVFVPRRRTEFLVRQAADRARRLEARRRIVVVDLCCGSGALGVAFAAIVAAAPTEPQVPVELFAADQDPAAVRCARRNTAALGGLVQCGDLFEALPVTLRGRIDVLLANVPYVPTDEVAFLPPEARLHEARLALDGGADGLDVLRRVSVQAPQWLAPGGHVLFETSERQTASALATIARAGLIPSVARSDELSATAVIGTRGSH